MRPITSVDELAEPDVFESDEELEEFLAGLYAFSPGQPRVSFVVLDTDVASS